MDRPDLVSSIFKLKKQQLINDLGSKMIFGKLLARSYSIEFQKRGFPHKHIIFWLQNRVVIDTKNYELICAEILDEYVYIKQKR